MLLGKKRILPLLLICIAIISTAHGNRKPHIRDPQECYRCKGPLNSDCAKNQKTLRIASNIQTCDPSLPEFETSVPMCGTHISKTGIVKRGCFPGTGQQTCFKNSIGFQCLCREYQCNGREVNGS